MQLNDVIKRNLRLGWQIMTNEIDFKTEDYFIAYFDILGYKNMLNEKNVDINKNLLTAIDECIKTSHTVFYMASEISKNLYGNNQKDYEVDIKIKSFSDNFFFCTKKNPILLMIYVCVLQAVFVTKNIFIRGALNYGMLYYSESFVFGNGLIKAYELESQISIFPRLLIDDTYYLAMKNRIANDDFFTDDLRKETNKVLNDSINIDFDNNKYLNYLGLISYFDTKENENNELTLDFVLREHMNNIMNSLSLENRSIKQKYHWCRDYHNKFCSKNGHTDYIISTIQES